MASCPECGFDLTPSGTCSVCGYGTASHGRDRWSARKNRAGNVAGGASSTAEIAGPKVGGRVGKMSVGRQVLLAAAAVAACAAVAIVVVVLLRAPRPTAAAATTAQAANTLQSATPAEAPSPAGAAAPSAAAAAPAAASDVSGAPAGQPTETAAARDQEQGSGPSRDNPAFAAPVGASPLSVRASEAIDLYDPQVQPVYDLAKRTELPPTTSENAYVAWMLAHTDQQEKYVRWRWQRAQITERRGLVVHPRVLMAFLLTPREWFVRPFNLAKTYENTAIPIGYGQTISGPELVTHMTDELDPQPNQRVLEIGTGSGYQSAVLSELSNFVYTIEIVKPLAEQTNQIYLDHTKEMPQYANIHRRLADGYYGWPKYAPFDRIIVTTGIDHIPPELLKELSPGGIMLIPIGPPSGQVVLKITKTVDKDGTVHLTREDIYHGFKREIFVPFTATGGGTHNLGEAP